MADEPRCSPVKVAITSGPGGHGRLGHIARFVHRTVCMDAIRQERHELVDLLDILLRMSRAGYDETDTRIALPERLFLMRLTVDLLTGMLEACKLPPPEAAYGGQSDPVIKKRFGHKAEQMAAVIEGQLSGLKETEEARPEILKMLFDVASERAKKDAAREKKDEEQRRREVEQHAKAAELAKESWAREAGVREGVGPGGK